MKGRTSIEAFALCVVAIVLYLTMATPARAQIGPPPVRETIDANGVDLMSGVLRVSAPVIAVGQPGAGGLAYIRSYDSDERAWRDDLTGTINISAGAYFVSLFGSSEVFTLTGGTYTPQNENGATLTFAANQYTYTTRDGVVAVFDKALAGTAPTEANEGRVVSITTPAGEVRTFTYMTLNSTTQRLQSVTNSYGYQIKFEYLNNDPATGGLTLTKVTAINNAVDYCDPAVNGCTGLTQTWPSLSFNAALPTEITDPAGRVMRYTYNGTGQMTAIRRPSSASNNVTYTYNGSNYVATASNGTGAWSYSYNTSGVWAVTVTDPLSHTNVYAAGFRGGPFVSYTDGLGRAVAYSYDIFSRLTQIRQPESNATQFAYDARGNITSVTQIPKPGSGLANIVTSASFPASCANPRTCNQPTSITDARGNVTNFTYDATHGGVTAITAPDPDGAGPAVRPQTRVSYSQISAYYKNAAGTIVAGPAMWMPTETSACATTASCANGADETRTVIDYGPSGVANNRLPVSSTVRAGNNAVATTTTASFDIFGNTTSVDGPLAGTDDTTRLYYDAARQTIGIVGPDPDGAGALKPRAQRFSYNLDGQVTSVETGTVNAVTDPWPNTFAALEQATLAYDAIGRNTRASLIASGATQAVTQLSYDNANRLDCTAVRMNPAVFASLPASACTLSTQGANGPDRIARTSYNNANQAIQVTSGYATAAPINEATSTFTTNGLQATLADGAGNLTTFEYDGFDRLTRLRYPNASGGGSSSGDYEQYSYDAGSNVTQTRLRDGQVIASTYDGLNRLTLTDAPGAANDITYAYDNFSRQTAIGALSFAYDQLSRLTSAAAALGTVSYQYDAASRRTRMTWPDGFFVTYDYDLANAVTAIRENGAASGAGVLASFGYDDLGRRASLTRGNGAVTAYAYDAASRLATLTQDLPGGAANDQIYGLSYNAASQVTQRTGSNAAYNTPAPVNGTTPYARDGLNRYTNAGRFAYDLRGNLSTDGSRIYGYDVFNRLVSVTPSAGGAGASLAYDAAGRLRETVSSGVTTRFLYDGSDMIAEYNGSNVLQRRYVHGPGVDEPLVWYEGAGTSDRRYLITDQIGSVVAANGNASTTINAYDEFGQPSATNTGRFQYTGQMWLGEAQVYHYKARAYLPQLGRFAQTDPILYAGGMNLYAYVQNDPVNFTDPSGLCGWVSELWEFRVLTRDSNVEDEGGSWVQELRAFTGSCEFPRDLGLGGGDAGGGGDGGGWIEAQLEAPIVPFEICWAVEAELSVGAAAAVEGALGPIHGGASANLNSLSRRLEWNQWTSLFSPRDYGWVRSQGGGVEATILGVHGALGAERSTTSPTEPLGPLHAYGESRVGLGGGGQLGVGLSGFAGLKFGDECAEQRPPL